MGLAATGSILLAAQAKADLSESFSGSYGPSGTPINTTIYLQGFNTSLGTLDSVTLTLATADTTSISIVNTTGSPQSYTSATATIGITATVPSSGLSVTSTTTSSGVSGSIGSAVGPYYLAPATTDGFASTGAQTSNLGDYETTGIYPVDISATSGIYAGSAVQGVIFGGNATSSGTLEVTYDYTPVATPEPSSLIGGFGILGSMAVMAWRKRKQ